jgi:hypothetical protein
MPSPKHDSGDIAGRAVSAEGTRLSDVVPFRGRIVRASVPTRVLHRFTKAGGSVAEIRERIVTPFKALEYLVYINGQLSESQMFHGARVELYASELEARIAQFIDGGWVEDRTKF